MAVIKPLESLEWRLKWILAATLPLDSSYEYQEPISVIESKKISDFGDRYFAPAGDWHVEHVATAIKIAAIAGIDEDLFDFAEITA